MDLFILQNSSIVTTLVRFAREHPRPDGWVLLADGGQEVASSIPDYRVSMQQQFSFRNLMKLMEASGLFDIQQELAPNGQQRPIYRASLAEIVASNLPPSDGQLAS